MLTLCVTKCCFLKEAELTKNSLSGEGFPSECYEYVLLSLVNKEAALAYGRAEYKVGSPSRERGGGKMVESERRHVALKEKIARTLPVSHNLMVIYR